MMNRSGIFCTKSVCYIRLINPTAILSLNVWFIYVCSNSVTLTLANVHSFILRDCKQTVWAGDQSTEVSMVQVSINERKKEQIKHKQLKVPNLPYSKMMLLEQIRQGADPYLELCSHSFLFPYSNWYLVIL